MTNQTVINLDHLFENDIDFENQLANWFDLLFLMKQTEEMHPKEVTMGNLVAWKKINTMMSNEGARGGKKTRFVDFKKSELMSHLSFYLLHSVSSSSQVKTKLNK